MDCGNLELYERLLHYINTGNASSNVSGCNTSKESDVPMVYQTGRTFYAYATPVIFVIGIIGNVLSLRIFLSKNMKKLSASSYLAALSVSDILVLIFYVLVEWLKRGLVYISPTTKIYFLEQNGICQTFLYISYAFRFLSPWIVTAFTVERYIGVCHPLLRRYICSLKGSRRIICGLTITSLIIVIYKPILSGVYLSHDGMKYCTANVEHDFLSFILDSAFALLITLVPFVLISILNILIMRKLCLRKAQFSVFGKRSGNHEKPRSIAFMKSEDGGIRFEFTVILFLISFFFIAFNAPYFIVWFRSFLHSKYLTKQFFTYHLDYWQGILYISRTIFYMNYCVNFFLYSFSGRSFRKQLKTLCQCQNRSGGYWFSRASSTNQSWI